MPLKCPAEWSLLLPPPPLGVPLHKGALCVCGHLHRRPLHTCVRTSFCMLSGRMGQWWAADDVCRMVRRHLMPCGVPKLSHPEHQTYVSHNALRVSPRRSSLSFCRVSVVCLVGFRTTSHARNIRKCGTATIPGGCTQAQLF